MNGQFGSISYPVLDQLQLTTLSAFRDEIATATLDRESSAFGMLKAMSVDETGWNLEIKNRVKRGNVGAFRGASPINTERVEMLAGGAIEWKEYYAAVTIDQRTLLQNCNLTVKDVAQMTSWSDLRSDSRDKLIDLLGTELVLSLEDLTDRLSEDVYRDGVPRRNEPDILEGFGAIIEPNKPYAGVGYRDYGRFKRRGKLSQTQNFVWNPISYDFQNKSARWNHYYSAMHDVHRGRRSGEIWWFMPSIHYDNITLMLEGAKTRNKMAEELGFEDHIKALHFNATFFPDDYCQGPDGNEDVVYGFRPRDLKMVIHSADNMTFHQAVIPDNQFSIIFRVTITLCLRCTERARTIKFYNINP